MQKNAANIQIIFEVGFFLCDRKVRRFRKLQPPQIRKPIDVPESVRPLLLTRIFHFPFAIFAISAMRRPASKAAWRSSSQCSSRYFLLASSSKPASS